MQACPSCGHSNTAEAHLCAHCNALLGAPAEFAPIEQATRKDKVNGWLRFQFRDLNDYKFQKRDRTVLAVWGLIAIGVIVIMARLIALFFVPQ